ncbi:hypothetical protein D8I35_03140 [Corticibacter populi]|uniref:Oxidoreductase n=1 Tax=Corticibacter populi TaxID=1550736 RepID=A0A3M6QYN3_9BURK|nr:hypothetical protein D8I35_03140 [Corticibacter populi]
MLNELSYKLLVRPGSTGSTSTTARTSADFHIDGESLLRTIVKQHGGHGDFMGALVRGYPESQADVARQLTLQGAPESDSGRVLLYICPECGDIGCGAYSVKVSRDQRTYTWGDFAYENGYENPRLLETVGPFVFEAIQYETAVESASAL